MSLLILAADLIVCYALADKFSLEQRVLCWSLSIFVAALVLYPAKEEVLRVEDSEPDWMFVPQELASQPQGEVALPRVSVATSGTPKGFYEREAQIVEAILQELHKVPCVIEDQIIMAPTFVGYILRDNGKVQHRILDEVSTDLGRQINQHSRTFKYGDVQVLISKSQPLVIQATRANIQSLGWEMRDKIWFPSEMATCIGMAWYGIKIIPVVIDMAQEHMMSAGFFGSQGSGKSTLARIALVNLLRNTPPDKLQVWGIDTKANSFKRFAGVPHMQQYTSDPSAALEILREFARWCTADGRPQDGTVRLLVIDEFHDLLLNEDIGKEAMKCMVDILSKGRAGLDDTYAKIRCWMITQDPDKDNYPPKIKKLTHAMIAGFTLYDNYLSDQLNVHGASKIKPQKEAIITSADHPNMRFSSFQMSEEVFAQELREIEQKWGSMEKKEVRMPNQTTVPVAHKEVDEVAQQIATSVPRKIVPVRNLPSRALSPDEREAVRGLAVRPEFQYGGKPSIRKLRDHVYMGKQSNTKDAWIKEALVEGGLA